MLEPADVAGDLEKGNPLGVRVFALKEGKKTIVK